MLPLPKDRAGSPLSVRARMTRSTFGGEVQRAKPIPPAVREKTREDVVASWLLATGALVFATACGSAVLHCIDRVAGWACSAPRHAAGNAGLSFRNSRDRHCRTGVCSWTGDLLAHFQDDDPGWQERIKDDALRQAARL